MKKTNLTEKSKTNFKNISGVTLIALVITIIVLLILAGVTLNLALDEDGIIRKALEVSRKYKEAEKNELANLNEFIWGLDDLLGKNDEPIPEGMYYSIRNGNEKKYYATFKEAYDASTDNGEVYRGGTIVVEKNVTEDLEEPIIMNKNITIDLKQNTMTRNQRIYLTGGTLTITGEDSSAIIGSGEDMFLLVVANDANLTILGSPLIQSTSHAILTLEPNFHPADLSSDVILSQSSGTVNLQGGYIVSTERSGMGIKGTGDIFINNTTVFGIRNDKNGLSITEDSSSDIVIDGNSIIASGSEYVGGSLNGAISDTSTGNLTIKGNTIVTAGLYGSNGINFNRGKELKILENTKVYAGSDGPHQAIHLNKNGCNNDIIVTVDTTGGIFSRCNDHLFFNNLNPDKNQLQFNILSGSFAIDSIDYLGQEDHEPLRCIKDYLGDNYPGEGTIQSVDFYYLEDYKTLKSVTIPNLCVVKVEK